MATYNYTVTASGNSYYLWNGHGLVDAQNPDLFFRAGDTVTITNASGGHPMRITNDAAPSVGPIDESNGAIFVDPVSEGSFTYFCTSHPSAMRGAITVSRAYANEGPEDGYGTGPLIGHDAGPLSMNEIRTKINEIITKGGVGGTPGTSGGSISVSTDAPPSPSDGDLWWDSDTASLYVYFADRDAWIQTNGAVGGGGGAVKSGPQTITLNSEIAFDHGLGDYPDLIEGYLTCTQAEFGYQPGDRLLVSSNYFSDGTPGSSQDHGVSFNATPTQAIALIGEDIEIPSRSNPGTSPSIDHDGIGLSNWKLEIVAMKVSGGSGGGGGDASIKVSATAPDPAEDGDLWFNTTQAELYVYVDAENAWIQTNGGGGSGSGNFSTGWVQTDGTENLAAGKTLTFDHNLGTTDLTTQIWVADNASGDNAFQVINAAATSYGSNAPWNVGASITNITTTSLSVTIAEDSVAKWSSSGNLQEVDVAPSTGKYIKVIASAGGGGAGPRAHVSFDGKDPNVNSTKANVFNVSSITDNATGNYTVTFANPISNPVLSATIASDQTYAQNPYPKESKIAVFEISSTSVQVRTGRGSYSAIDCPVHLVVF